MTHDNVTTKTAIAALTDCRSNLAEHAAIMKQAVGAGDQQAEPPAIMFQRAFDFGLQAIDAIIRLLGDGEQYALHACTLCRPFYETAVRLLWASRTPDGWQRLQAYYANEDRKWADEARRISSTAEIAASTRQHREEILERTDETGEKFCIAPGMQQLLRDVVKHDMIEGIREESDRSADFDYTNVYRFLCKAAHGHMTSLGRPASLLRHAKYGTIMAIWCLLQAQCHVGAKDFSKEIDVIGKKLMKIIEEHRG